MRFMGVPRALWEPVVSSCKDMAARERLLVAGEGGNGESMTEGDVSTVRVNLWEDEEEEKQRVWRHALLLRSWHLLVAIRAGATERGGVWRETRHLLLLYRHCPPLPHARHGGDQRFCAAEEKYEMQTCGHVVILLYLQFYWRWNQTRCWPVPSRRMDWGGALPAMVG